MGGLFGYLIRNVKIYFYNKSLRLYLFSFINSSIWFMPFISTMGLVFSPLMLGFKVFKSFDQGWSEYLGGQKIYKFIVYFSAINQAIQNNNLKIYLTLLIF